MKMYRRVRATGKGGAVAALLALVAFAGIGIGAYYVAVAQGTRRPPTPKLAASVTNPTTSTSVQFTFSDAQHGVTFRCALDRRHFRSCASGITYRHLHDGDHTFSVVAIAGSVASSAATQTWTVDTTGPWVRVYFPRNRHHYTADEWNTACGGGGICGQAFDRNGVASVRVGVRSFARHKYWNGTRFRSRRPVLLDATGTTNWRSPMPVPPDGYYRVVISTTDTLGNVRFFSDVLHFGMSSATNTISVVSGAPQTATAGATFAAPLQAAVTDTSNNPVAGVTVTFTAPGSGTSGTFAGGVNTAVTDANGIATSAAFTANNATGSYTVVATRVRSERDRDFCAHQRGRRRLRYQRQPDRIAASRRTVPLTLTVHNPDVSPVTIDPNGITVTVTSNKAGCASSDFTGSTGPAAPVTIEPGATTTLGGFTVRMINQPYNQDACKDASLTLTYTATGGGS